MKKSAQSRKLVERLLAGDVALPSLPEDTADLVRELIGDNETFYNTMAPGIVRNLASRALDGINSNVYSKSETNDIFSNAAKPPTFAEFPKRKQDQDTASTSSSHTTAPVTASTKANHKTNHSGAKSTGGFTLKNPEIFGFANNDNALEDAAYRSFHNFDLPIYITQPARPEQPKEKTDQVDLFNSDDTARSLQQSNSFLSKLTGKHWNTTAKVLSGLALSGVALYAYNRAKKNKEKKRQEKRKERMLMALENLANKKKKNILKVANLQGWLARTYSPDFNLFDDMVTAATKNDYSNVNDKIRDRFNTYMDKGYVDFLKHPFAWQTMFSSPGDKVEWVPPTGNAKNAYIGAISSFTPTTDRQKKLGRRPFNIPYDPRQGIFDFIAATMLPVDSGKYSYRQYPNVGNMAHYMPAPNQILAQNMGLTQEDKDEIAENGADVLAMNSVKNLANTAPGIKNLVSAFINGGYGDVNNPRDFSLSRPFWDFSASAPTPEGSNILHRAVENIGNAGGYGGTTDYGALDDISRVNGAADLYIKLGSLFKQEDLDKILKNPDSVAPYRNVTEEQIEELLNSPPYKYKDRSGKEKTLDPIHHEYRKRLAEAKTLEEKQNILWDLHNNALIGKIISEINGIQGLPVSKALGDIYRTYEANNTGRLKSGIKGLVNKYNDERSMRNEFALPYTGYDESLKDLHYKELLRFFDNVGPDLFMPKTVLGGSMFYHPVGGLLPNMEKLYDTFIPYIREDPDLLEKLDEASGRNISTVRKMMQEANKKNSTGSRRQSHGK